MTTEEAAIAAGATQLGEEGPDGAHWIFSREQLEAFAASCREAPKWRKINECMWESTRDEPREIPRPNEMIREALDAALKLPPLPY